MMVNLSAGVDAEGEILTPAEAAKFFAELPQEALASGRLAIHMTDRGNQRDPNRVPTGIKVHWQEQRS